MKYEELEKISDIVLNMEKASVIEIYVQDYKCWVTEKDISFEMTTSSVDDAVIKANNVSLVLSNESKKNMHGWELVPRASFKSGL